MADYGGMLAAFLGFTHMQIVVPWSPPPWLGCDTCQALRYCMVPVQFTMITTQNA